MPAPYHPPVKRSLAIAGHRTSISLEPLFWDLLKRAAGEEGLAVSAMVARIDAERIRAENPPGLAGAIRVWLAARIIDRSACEADFDTSIEEIEE
ncbi:MAG: ribbon-helix-helix domain-containing protein [Erythrobacter sp.]|nr:ribbon-helix-helix domain-containing protein [Erythrobacter sp.]